MLQTVVVPFTGQFTNGFYGGLEVDLADDEEEDSESQKPTTKTKMTYQCIATCPCPCACSCPCPFRPAKQGTSGLDLLLGHMQKKHSHSPDYKVKVEQTKDLYEKGRRKNKTEKTLVCNLCRRTVVDKGLSSLRRHQNTSLCKRKQGKHCDETEVKRARR